MTSLDLPEALFLHPLSSAPDTITTPSFLLLLLPPPLAAIIPTLVSSAQRTPHFCTPSSLRLRRRNVQKISLNARSLVMRQWALKEREGNSPDFVPPSSPPTSSSVCQLREMRKRWNRLARAEFDDASSYRGCTPDNHYASSFFTACSYGCDFLEWVLPMIFLPSPHTYLYFPLFPPCARFCAHEPVPRSRGQT